MSRRYSSSDSENEFEAIVIDNGSCNIRAGLAGDCTCRSYFPTIVGQERCLSTDGTSMQGEARGLLVGRAARDALKTTPLTFSNPVQRGIITDWDAMERIWEHAFNDLSVSPGERPVLLSEVSLNPKGNREKMAQVMFEKFNVPALFIANSASLALYSDGLTTGMVFDSGEGVSHVAAICEGYQLPACTLRQDLAGIDVTKYLGRLLTKRGYSFSTASDEIILREAKDRMAFVAQSKPIFDFQKTLHSEEIIDLPDGKSITVGDERFLCTEPLFQPSLIDLPQFLGVHEMIHQSLMRCDADTRGEVMKHIFLSGANCMYRGMFDRVHGEMAALARANGYSKLKVSAPPERRSSTWIGGSILASLTSFQDLWITKDEYSEAGPNIVHRCSV